MSLVVFDFDGSLSATDPTVLLGREFDVATEMSGLAEQSRRDEIAVAESLRQRVGLLEGMRDRRVVDAFQRCKLRDGAGELIAALRRSDQQVGIVTLGFERCVDAALDRAGVSVDHLIANRLVLENGALTGDVAGPLLDGRKDRALEELSANTGIDLSESIAVGDDEMDLPMLQVAGTAIGFLPDPVVEDHCDVVVQSVRDLRLHFEQHGIVTADDVDA